MRTRLLPLVIAVAAVGAASSGAKAQTLVTCPNVFSVCVDFTLTYTQTSTGYDWRLLTNYVSAPSGLLTATGIYYNGKPAPNFGITNVQVFPTTTTGWQAGAGCTDLSFQNGTTVLTSACESTTNGINYAVAPGGQIQVTFSSTGSAFYDAWTANPSLLGFRAHIQGYGATNCSLKLDTGVRGYVASTDCAPPSTVPEPVSIVLLASGLGGLALPALRRRRRERKEA